MRLFLAIELAEVLQDVLKKTQEDIIKTNARVRFTKREQLHLTFQFLGEVSSERLSEIKDAVKKIASNSSSFSMIFDSLGCFPQRGKVRILWAGVSDPPQKLLSLAQLCEEEFSKLGFPAENRLYSPHVTIGRVKEDKSKGALRESLVALSLPPYEQSVSTVTLFESQLQQGGAVYRIIAKEKLLL